MQYTKKSFFLAILLFSCTTFSAFGFPSVVARQDSFEMALLQFPFVLGVALLFLSSDKVKNELKEYSGLTLPLVIGLWFLITVVSSATFVGFIYLEEMFW